MNFEQYVPAAIIAAAILGTWFDVRREISDMRREIGGVRGELFTLNGRVSHIEGLLSPQPAEVSSSVVSEGAQSGTAR